MIPEAGWKLWREHFSGEPECAALELCLLSAWNLLGEFALPNSELAVVAWRGDNEYVGVKCGVMDQMASAIGEEGKAIFLDTRSLETSLWPIPGDISLAVLDT